MGYLAAIQALLDEHRSEWWVRDAVVVVGLERIDADGEVRTAVAMYAPDTQGTEVTDGLIEYARRVQGGP